MEKASSAVSSSSDSSSSSVALLVCCHGKGWRSSLRLEGCQLGKMLDGVPCLIHLFTSSLGHGMYTQDGASGCTLVSTLHDHLTLIQNADSIFI